MVNDRVLHTKDSLPVGVLPGRLDLLRQRIADHVTSGRTPALCVVAALDGEIIFNEALGTRAPGDQLVTTDDPYNVMSITKSVVALCIMALVEDGLLMVTQPVGDYLEELRRPGEEDLLVHHLLTHTSGYDDETLMPRWFAKAVSGEKIDVPEGFDLETHLWLSSSWESTRVQPVGSAMVYANINYLWLGEIVRRVSGVSLAHFAHERIFGPLGMTNTAFVLTPEQEERRVKRFGNIPLGPKAVYSTERPEFANSQLGDRSLKSSAKDLAILAQMYLNGGTYGGARILSPASIHQICTSQFPNLDFRLGSLVFKDPAYGYGMMMDTGTRFRYFNGALQPTGGCSHSGSGGSNLYFDPKNQLSIICLEIVTEMSPDSEPISGIGRVVSDMLYAALENFQPYGAP